MAEVLNVGKDYMESIFPSVSTVSIDLATSTPASFIDIIKPNAYMIASIIPLTSKNSRNVETDEIFTRDILNKHQKINKNSKQIGELTL